MSDTASATTEVVQNTIQRPDAPTVGVFALMTPKVGVSREQIMAIAPAEVKATVQLYLQGKIRNWYARADGNGVIFFLNANSVAEAEPIMATLPFEQEDLVDTQYIPVNPLWPLGLLIRDR